MKLPVDGICLRTAELLTNKILTVLEELHQLFELKNVQWKKIMKGEYNVFYL